MGKASTKSIRARDQHQCFVCTTVINGGDTCLKVGVARNYRYACSTCMTDRGPNFVLALYEQLYTREKTSDHLLEKTTTEMKELTDKMKLS